MDRMHTRESPLFSVVSILIAVVFLTGLGIKFVINGNQIFSPGLVSAKTRPGVVYSNFHSHVDFEDQCGLCHRPLQSSQAELCVDCHKEIARQVKSTSGVHGRFTNVQQCATCHSEHQGREFDPVQAAINSFDHNITRFALTGKHFELACQDCHAHGSYDQAPVECAACHAEPKQHAGMFGADCTSCHTTTAWKPASFQGKAFDHEKVGFSLALHARDYNGQALACTGCHTSGTPRSADDQPCAACHSQHDTGFVTKHTVQYGAACTACHDGVDHMHNFEHNAVFALEGKHAGLKCDSCHANQRFSGTPTVCTGCHKEPAIHAGAFGLKCELCHTTQAWQPAKLRAHSFPLNHGSKGDSSCQTCHNGSYAQYTCYTCHDHQADEIAKSHSLVGINATDVQDCAACHLDGRVHKP